MTHPFFFSFLFFRFVSLLCNFCLSFEYIKMKKTTQQAYLPATDAFAIKNATAPGRGASIAHRSRWRLRKVHIGLSRVENLFRGHLRSRIGHWIWIKKKFSLLRLTFIVLIEKEKKRKSLIIHETVFHKISMFFFSLRFKIDSNYVHKSLYYLIPYFVIYPQESYVITIDDIMHDIVLHINAMDFRV